MVVPFQREAGVADKRNTVTLALPSCMVVAREVCYDVPFIQYIEQVRGSLYFKHGNIGVKWKVGKHNNRRSFRYPFKGGRDPVQGILFYFHIGTHAVCQIQENQGCIFMDNKVIHPVTAKHLLIPGPAVVAGFCDIMVSHNGIPGVFKTVELVLDTQELFGCSVVGQVSADNNKIIAVCKLIPVIDALAEVPGLLLGCDMNVITE